MTDTTPLNWMDRFNATNNVWIVQPGDYVALIHKVAPNIETELLPDENVS